MKMLLIENMRKRAFLLSCLRFSTSLFTTHTLKYRRLKNINKVLDKLLILDIRLFENRLKFSLTLDRRSALRARAGQQIMLSVWLTLGLDTLDTSHVSSPSPSWNPTPWTKNSTMIALLLMLAVTGPVTSGGGGGEVVRVYDIGQTGLVTCPGRNATGLNLDKLRSVTFYKDSTKKIFTWVLK